MEGALLLDVVVGESPAVLQLLPGEDQPLLVRGDSLLVLDLGLHILDRVRGLDLRMKAMIMTITTLLQPTSRVMVFPVRVFTKICMMTGLLESAIHQAQVSPRQ